MRLNCIENIDCLEGMKAIPDGSIDLVLTDPPYGTMDTDGGRRLRIDGWDKRVPAADLLQHFARILRPNGKAVVFSQSDYTAELMTQAPPVLPFSYRAVWLKDQFANCLGVNKAMVSLYEDICVFSKLAPKHDFAGDHPLREYFLQERAKCGGINFRELLGNGMAGHYFTNGAQFALPTRANYEKLQTTGHFNRDYDEIKEIHDRFQKEMIERMNAENPAVFNLWQGKKYKSNVLEYKKDNDGLHPTQKPLALIEDLVNTYSNPGDKVLDPFMGSGTTAVACLKTGRKYIGFELDERYYATSVQRIADADAREEGYL